MAKFKYKDYSKKVIDEVRKNAKIALLQNAGDLKRESQQVVPIDTKDLQRNCNIDDRQLDKGVVKVGYDLKYALEQHENLEYRHDPGRKAKYLEDPFNANKDKYIDNVAKKIKEVTGD